MNYLKVFIAYLITVVALSVSVWLMILDYQTAPGELGVHGIASIAVAVLALLVVNEIKKTVP